MTGMTEDDFVFLNIPKAVMINSNVVLTYLDLQYPAVVKEINFSEGGVRFIVEYAKDGDIFARACTLSELGWVEEEKEFTDGENIISFPKPKKDKIH